MSPTTTTTTTSYSWELPQKDEHGHLISYRLQGDEQMNEKAVVPSTITTTPCPPVQTHKNDITPSFSRSHPL
jgi:hypothetical protein